MTMLRTLTKKRYPGKEDLETLNDLRGKYGKK